MRLRYGMQQIRRTGGNWDSYDRKPATQSSDGAPREKMLSAVESYAASMARYSGNSIMDGKTCRKTGAKSELLCLGDNIATAVKRYR